MFISEEFLPQPFAWVTIPAGDVTLICDLEYSDDYIYDISGGYDRVTFHVPSFQISKYPITVAQYAKFLNIGGYETDKWWTDTGNIIKKKSEWEAPRFWEKQWKNDIYPVMGVSWYEALAFCTWLSDFTGENIMLPSDQQWQRAAQGDDGRNYPWGNEWDGSRCNNSISPYKSRNLTPVTQFEGKGDSPFGVVDMAGNVWEWCLTSGETGTNELEITPFHLRVIRGGDYHLDYGLVSLMLYREFENPASWGNNTGFRIARLTE